ncbi:UvrD-helicase domain-containing protein [Winogradskyella sediminis]|uniref:DNA 3'-5' helicase II n=1 Tax=Winogradskyella sediminis TaxID=1382466 RepID=A0A1H1XK98_9FLAO|nr:UvrD-helicase domain-containing protein [Winogradskyella sediminis]SDT09650.1 DNA helicase-2 / ATP-dependent DNA helicase PcrA [Winogradskyella sediminis]
MASEVDKIIETMNAGNHFLLSGGAGSGKTHTLIELIQRINEINPKSKIACITYTNVAADEITERANSFSVKASTIHDFLWDNIKGFQPNLRKGIIELNENITEDNLLKHIEIQYREYVSLKNGIISHSDVLKLSNYMFGKHPLLSKIINDKFDYIFVDEYQDTSNEVIDILFKNLNRKDFSLKIGLFGDSMQSIYKDGIGEIETTELINKDSQRRLIEVPKKLNRRNPQLVIDLANNLRNDKLEQKALPNSMAPNINKDGTVKKGNLTFLYSSLGTHQLEDIKKSKYCSNWDYENYDKNGKPITKILLTKNAEIAKYAGFNSLFDIYTKDKIVSSGYVKRIRDFLKTTKTVYNTESITFLELLDLLIKEEIDSKLTFKKGLELVKNEIPNFDTLLKAINAVNKLHLGIKNILPTGAMYTYIVQNSDLFDIALSMQFDDLSSIFLNKEKLIGKKKSKNSDSNNRNDEKDRFIKHLFKIQEIVSLYENKNINDLLKKVDFKIHLGKHKSILKEKMDDLCKLTTSEIKDIVDFADSSSILKIDSKVSDFISTKSYLVERIKRIDFSELTNLYNYTEGLSPYSTQHGVKGDEFDNVLVVVKKDKISQLTICYEYLFESNLNEEKYFKMTSNLFYVACSRAKENLVVFYDDVCSPKVISKAKELFGDNNVIDLNKI